MTYFLNKGEEYPILDRFCWIKTMP